MISMKSKKSFPIDTLFCWSIRLSNVIWSRDIVGIKNVTINEPFFQGHFPDFPVMPGVLIIEALAQVACILGIKIMNKEGQTSVFFTGIDGAKFRKPVVPGDQLRLELTKIKQRGTLFRFEGKAFVGDTLATECTIQAMLGKD